MTTQQGRQEIDRIFAAAVGLKHEARAAFLDEACANDAQLRTEVESLLAEQAPKSVAARDVDEEATRVFREKNELVAGQFIGRYEIIRPLGAGGMGHVYLCNDQRLNRPVAVKLLSSYHAAEEERIRRFRQEALAVSALNHPNILTIYEIGESQEHNFIATEFVDGVTLSARIKSGRMAIDESLNIAMQIAGALSAAHTAGIIHRDIKPANVMVRADGLVKVLDFGIAKYEQQQGETPGRESVIETIPGAVIGTASYMSPEQARGVTVDKRTDIWSWGVVLYEMLAGYRPFTGETEMDVMSAVIEREPPALATHNPLVPEPLEKIIFKALQKKRELRYQAASELMIDLKAAMQHLESGGIEKPRQGKIQAEGQVINSIAVLPFKLLSPAGPNDYLGIGLADALVVRLSKLRQLTVRPTSSARKYGDSDQDPVVAGRALGVEAVLDGNIHLAGDRVRVTAQLIHVAQQAPLWADKFDAQFTDIFDVEDSISEQVGEALTPKLTGEDRKRLTKRYTENIEAYQLYLKGRYHWSKRTSEGTRRAVEHFRAAIDLDPENALAYTGLADCYTQLGWMKLSAPADTFPAAKAAAQRALELDDTLAEAHSSLAWARILYDWAWAESEEAFRRALELNPNYAVAHMWYGTLLIAVGRFEEAITAMRRAQELDPLSPITNATIGLPYYLSRSYEQAVECYRKALQLEPNSLPAHLLLGRAYLQIGKAALGVAEMEKARALENSSFVQAELGHALAVAGRRDEARDILAQLQSQAAQVYVSPYDLAGLNTVLGEKEEALRLLEEACLDRSAWVMLLGVDPELDPLRKEARFVEMLRRTGLADALQKKER